MNNTITFMDEADLDLIKDEMILMGDDFEVDYLTIIINESDEIINAWWEVIREENINAK